MVRFAEVGGHFTCCLWGKGEVAVLAWGFEESGAWLMMNVDENVSVNSCAAWRWGPLDDVRRCYVIVWH